MTAEEFKEWAKPYNLVTFFKKYQMYYVDDPELNEEQNEQIEEVVDLGNSLKVLYFAFTSLSTVGFGDIRPESDSERLLGAGILLIGVAVFSYIMGIFIGILDQHQNLHADFDDGDVLTQFFGLLRHYNSNMPIKLSLKEEIEDFFDFKWANDRNQALTEDEDLAFYNKLPENVQTKIYREFYYANFCYAFREVFSIENSLG